MKSLLEPGLSLYVVYRFANTGFRVFKVLFELQGLISEVGFLCSSWADGGRRLAIVGCIFL